MPNEHWKRLESIFLEAADLGGAGRSSYLDQACGGDAGLRKEVEAMLAADEGHPETIESVLKAAARDLVAEDLLVDQSLEGKRFGVYLIRKVIGHGGMGDVYLAVRDDDEFQKQVALKVVRRGMDTAEVLERFRHERQILANLDHPYVAKLLDGGTTGDGVPFFVMEYVPGVSIDAYCRDRELPVRQRCELFLKVCDAVAYAHRSLVIHRDLKPGNIFVTADGVPKLLDFGVAKLLAPGDNADATATMLSRRPLTPNYASPEQVRGLRVTTAADVYSLGVVLYELLAGSRCFDLGSKSFTEIEKAICEDAVTPPSTRSLAAQSGEIDSDLDNIVMMAMHKEPERRYSSVEQLSADVERYLSGHPVMARRESLVYVARKFASRNRLALAAASLVVISLVGGTAIAWRQSVEARQAQQRAEQRLAQMLDLANRALYDVHESIMPLPGSTEARRKIVKTTIEYLENLAKGEMDDRLRRALASAYYKVGDLQGLPVMPNLGDSKGAVDSYNKAESILQPVLQRRGNEKQVLLLAISIHNRLGLILRMTGHPKESLAAYQRDVPVVERLVELNPNDPTALDEQAILFRAMSRAFPPDRMPEALDYAQKGLALAKRLVEWKPDSLKFKLGLSDAHAQTALLMQSMMRLQEAAEHRGISVKMREALTAQRPNDTEYLRTLMVSYNNLAGVLGIPILPNLGRVDEARDLTEKALRIARQMVALDPANVLAKTDAAVAEMRLASVMDEKPQESLSILQRVAGFFAEAGRKDPNNAQHDLNQAVAWHQIGRRLRTLGKAREALEAFGKGQDLAMRRISQPGMDIQVLADEEAIAELLAEMGKAAEALDRVGKAVAEARTRRFPDLYVAQAEVSTAVVHATLRRCATAVPIARGALERLTRAGNPARAYPFAAGALRAKAVIAACPAATNSSH